MHTVLVTGCAGFIGSHVCEQLLAQGYRVLGLDNFDLFYDRRRKEVNMAALLLHPGFVFYELDLRAGSLALHENLPPEEIDIVVHLAAKAGVGLSVREPQAYLENNVQGTLHLLEWMRQRCITKLFFSSSSSVYGNTAQKPFREDMALVHSCLSPYAVSKLAGEHLTHTYHHLYGLSVIVGRFFTVYGPRQRPDLAIYKFAQLLRQQQPIPVYGDGSTARDYTFVDDTVAGILQGVAYLVRKQCVYEIVNLGNHHPVPLLTLIRAVAAAVGIPGKPHLVFQPMQAGDADTTFADIGKAHQLLGYTPRTTLDDGLQQFVAWLDQPTLVDTI
ncbi:GDP-mannose 4,6-dehydratase [Hymenobacter elongatus]|uniref:NAD-dependent epimerase/dehydratase family protein n=1 Tax=Hymenobacter elongatus TaxID=877208 RepID=A0A4Z0PQC4_9BACT|nr:GDP-mannose 4,6-dehydratase [Hymenobacter elongatus]TGE18083.1 NAD-dependent epimerase/dehydratase family protein [Hymenobacter elongatus]